VWSAHDLRKKDHFAFTCFCLICIFLQLCMFSYWSAHVERQTTADVIAASLYLVLMAASTALFARVILISSPAG
jgi:hypothetical protein